MNEYRWPFWKYMNLRWDLKGFDIITNTIPPSLAGGTLEMRTLNWLPEDPYSGEEFFPLLDQSLPMPLGGIRSWTIRHRNHWRFYRKSVELHVVRRHVMFTHLVNHYYGLRVPPVSGGLDGVLDYLHTYLRLNGIE